MAILQEQFFSRPVKSSAASYRKRLTALLLLLFFAPLILVIYVLVRADGGCAFVSHEHRGADARLVGAWRFRTFRDTPQKTTHHEVTPPRGTDPTTIGVLLRRCRLEVLPTLYNVCKGEMSFSEFLSQI